MEPDIITHVTEVLKNEYICGFLYIPKKILIRLTF